jgi:hypothetical protein
VRVRVASAKVPTPQLLKVSERCGPVVTAASKARMLEEIEMMSHKPNCACRQKSAEEIRPDLIVQRPVYGFADIVKERCGPEHTIVCCAARQIEHLKRVIESVALGVILRRLAYAVKISEKRKQIVMYIHRPAGRIAAA